MAIYPLMFLSIFFYRKFLKGVILAVSLSVVIFFSSWYYIQVYAGRNPLGSLLVGQRLILPAIPLLLLTYADFLDRIFKKAKGYYAMITNTLVILLILAVFLVSSKHQQYLNRLVIYKQKIYSSIPEDSLIICNGEILKFLQDAWG